MEVIVKFKPHYNRAMPEWKTDKGTWYGSQKQYDADMKKYNMVSSEQKESQVYKRKEYNLSNDAEEIIREAKLKSKNGKLKLTMSDGLVTKMIDKGIVKPKGFGLEFLPEHLKRGL